MKYRELKKEFNAVDENRIIQHPKSHKDAVQNISISLKIFVAILTALRDSPITGKKFDRWATGIINSLQIITGTAEVVDDIIH